MHRLSLVAALALTSCAGGLTALYPPRPPAVPGQPVADPTPSRVVVHATVSEAALRQALDELLPRTDSGTFSLLGSTRDYTWQRVSTTVGFQQGRIDVQARIQADVDLPLTTARVSIDLKILTEPVVTADYHARLQSTQVEVTSTDRRLKLAQGVSGVLDGIQHAIEAQLGDFSFDLRPMLDEAYLRVARPLELPLGDARGCAELKVLSVEAGPTVLAGGVEKDLALVIAPSVTLPCTAPPEPAPLPPLANVAALPSGPFTVSVPIAARYEELQRAMSLAFTDGKLYFAKDFPELYLERPEVYAAGDVLVLKLHIGGPVKKGPISTVLDGDLYMIGHPTVIDNELRVPDLEPTIETGNFLLKLKAVLDGDSIREQARAALRLDIGDRLRQVRDKLSSELSFAAGQGCLRATADKIEVTGVHPHANYLRLYVALTGRAAVYLPCPQAPLPVPPTESASTSADFSSSM